MSQWELCRKVTDIRLRPCYSVTIFVKNFHAQQASKSRNNNATNHSQNCV